MLGRRSHHPLHPTLRLLAAGGRHWARIAGQLAIYRLLGGLFLLALLFSRAIMPPHMVHPLYRPLQMDGSAQNLMIITLEFRKSTFSGNGVYAQSIARALARTGYEVLVLSGKPVRHLSSGTHHAASRKSASNFSKELGQGKALSIKRSGKHALMGQNDLTNHAHETEMTIKQKSDLKKDPESGLIELEVEVEQDGWGRLDWKCPWQSFAQGISRYANQVLEFNPSWALVVDWSAVPAFEHLVLTSDNQWRMAFLNFRVYYVSEYQGDDGEAEKQFYKTMESKAVAMASAISALSSRDAHILAMELGAGIAPGVVPRPHFPPLREDLHALALVNRVTEESQNSVKWLKGRKFFTCCVRLSPEKNTELFPSVVEILAVFLQEQGIIPFLCGGAQGESTYAAQVKQRLKAAMPEAVIYEGFMGPSQLSDLYSQTLLNMHPCIYDAYGMTIVEAAAFASPSVVHVGLGGAVGAAEFLDPQKKQVLALDLTQSPTRIADNLRHLLLNQSHLAEVGWESCKRSLSWDEDANAEQLLSILRSAPRLISRGTGNKVLDIKS